MGRTKAQSLFQRMKLEAMSEWELVMVKFVLELYGGNRYEASKALGVDRAHFWRLLKKHGLPTRRVNDESEIKRE